MAGIKEAEVADSSGDPATDALALAIVQKTGPFGPIPADIERDQLEIFIPLDFTSE
jgi:TonB family protein